MNGLDLFSGIGGISLALKPWVRTVTYCESDRYAQSVLLSRMRSGDLDEAPIWDDVRTLKGGMLPKIDIITGGFPCQDISTAGNGIGLEGKRSGLFFEIVRLASELRPSFIFLENVPAITVRGLDRVLLELTALGFNCRWTIVSAAEVGAVHRRERWWLLAYSNREHRGEQLQPWKYEQENGLVTACAEGIASDSEGKRLQASWNHIGPEQKLSRPSGYNGWKSQPTVRGRNHGVPHRLDRLRCLGNSVVPLSAKKAFLILTGNLMLRTPQQ